MCRNRRPVRQAERGERAGHGPTESATNRAKATLSWKGDSSVTDCPRLNGLFGYALRLTNNRSDAEDLLQEATIKAYAGFRSFRKGTNLTAWLARIIANIVIDDYRRSQRRPPNTSSTNSSIGTAQRPALQGKWPFGGGRGDAQTTG